MKIFLDTNILFSAILFSDSTPERALIKALEGDYEIFTCSYVLDELIRVVSKKIPNKLEIVKKYFLEIQKRILVVDTVVVNMFNNVLLRDSKDIPILNTALYYGCDILITGDKDFLEAGLSSISVITASEFLKNY